MHFLTEQLDKGQMRYCAIHTLLKGYIKAYASFLSVHDLCWDLIESIVYHEKLGYAGRLDRLGYIDRQRAIIDLKTGCPQDYHGIQLGAYDLTLPYKDTKRYALYLRADGTFRLKDFTQDRYTGIWLATLDAWRIAHMLPSIGFFSPQGTAV